MIRRPPRSTLFPTRRSSDLPSGLRLTPTEPGTPPTRERGADRDVHYALLLGLVVLVEVVYGLPEALLGLDRKSTRLNSSHANISYAVFCLKKKTQQHPHLQ